MGAFGVFKMTTFKFKRKKKDAELSYKEKDEELTY